MSKTLGERRVRIDFNLTGSKTVDEVKRQSAALINLVEGMKLAEVSAGNTLDPEQLRLFALAQTAYEEAAMWAVKAATFGL